MKIVLFALGFLSCARAERPFIDTNAKFSANSPAGKKLLLKARVEEGPRHLEENEIILGNMFIKFEGCSTYEDRGIDYYEDWQNYKDQESYEEWKAYVSQQKNANAEENADGQADYTDEYAYDWNQEEAAEEGDEAAEEDGAERKLQNEEYNGANYNGANYDGANYDGETEWVNLVRFTLCYDNGCNACTGKYAIGMDDFLEAWYDHHKALNEYICGSVREYCSCGQNNENYNNNNNYSEEYGNYMLKQCYNQCYKAAGKYSCMEYDGNEENESQFQLGDYLQCKEMDYYSEGYANYQQYKSNSDGENGDYASNQQGNAGYYNNQQGNAGYYEEENEENKVYYIGPYCKDNSAIFLNAFTDEYCTYAAEHFVFKASYTTTNGGSFPFMKSPMLAQGDCISCQDEEEYYGEYDEAQQKYREYQWQQKYYNKYEERAENYENAQNWNYQDGEEEEKTSNELCGLAEDGDNVITCVYTNDADEDMLEGCLFLDVLPALDGRNEREVSNLANVLNMSERFTAVLGVAAIVMTSLVAVLCLCNPAKLGEDKRDSKTAALMPKGKNGLLIGRDIREDDSMAPSVTMVDKGIVA